MIKQWHSIQGVWDLMRDHERLINFYGKQENMNETSAYYDQIGYFRSDTYFPNPINIYEHDAGVPDFGHWLNGINDRLFYGKRKYAEIWSHRFSFSDIFEKSYMSKKLGYHS